MVSIDECKEKSRFESSGSIMLHGQQIPYHTICEDTFFNDKEGNPVGSAIAAVFFGFSDALATTLKGQGGTFPTEFLDMIPYAATIIALVVISSIRMSHLRKIQQGGK